MIEAIVLNDCIKLKILSPSSSFKEDVDMIKALPGRRYRDGYWYIPYEQKYNLIDIFGDDIQWHGETQDNVISIDTARQLNLNDVIEDIDITKFKLPPFPYQIVGASFLIDMGTAILADEPGVGKTFQAIIASDYLMTKGIISKVLVISLSSIKYQWANEITKFTNYTSTVIDGIPSKRKQQYATDVNFYLMNYELARIDDDLDIIKNMDFDLIILDEAHYIKDYNSQTATKLRQLHAKYKWLLTGTPMQNRLEELFSLFSFMDESILGKWQPFKKRYLEIGKKYGRYGVILGYKNQEEFRRKIAPYIMRRTVEEVLPQLPKLTITNYMVHLTDSQYRLHNEIQNDMIDIIKSLKNIKDPDVLKIKEDQMMGLRILLQEVCDSPQLLVMSDSKMVAKYRVTDTKSPKLEELKLIVTERIENNPNIKIVIFTQFERMQRIILESLSSHWECTLLNGKMKPYQKQASIDKFKYNDNIRFLICTDSANAGINLQEASLLINVDIPWNPAILTQRMGRIRRADSKHTILQVINLIALFGVDERMLDVLYDKEDMVSYLVDKTDEDKKVVADLTQKVIDQIVQKER